MFAAVCYLSESRKRKYDIRNVSNIDNFFEKFTKKKFKMTSPEGDILEGLVIFTGSDKEELQQKLNEDRVRIPPKNLCNTAPNLDFMLPDAKKESNKIRNKQVKNLNSTGHFTLTEKENAQIPESSTSSKVSSKKNKSEKLDKSWKNDVPLKSRENMKSVQNPTTEQIQVEAVGKLSSNKPTAARKTKFKGSTAEAKAGQKNASSKTAKKLSECIKGAAPITPLNDKKNTEENGKCVNKHSKCIKSSVKDTVAKRAQERAAYCSAKLTTSSTESKEEMSEKIKQLKKIIAEQKNIYLSRGRRLQI